MRCAIYARYSSDLQRESSIGDQIRRCRAFAALQGWSVTDEYVRFDEAKSAATMAGREKLQSLLIDVARKPAPFDCLLVDDTSRLARSLPDVLNMNERIRYFGAFIYAVAQRLDCREKTARSLLTLQGMMDEQYLTGLSEKVHRGQEGRALLGLQPGGRCFGYRNVPIEDPTRSAKYGRPAVSGVQLEIHSEQAPIVRRIFEMYAAGDSLATIAKTLNSERVTAPQPPRTRIMQAWCTSCIREMLRNERYRGVFVWNRTRKERNPDTGRKLSRARPQAEWQRIAVPGWRIVSEELWERVERQIKLVNQQFGSKRFGGLNRTDSSRRYLFSGLLICGTCGSHIVIGSGGGKSGHPRYGCPSHRYRGVCSNKLTIRQDRLEDQLLSAFEDRVLRPDLLTYTLSRFRTELQKKLAEMQRSERDSSKSVLEDKRKELQCRGSRLADAIAAAGHSSILLAQLASVESQIAEIDHRLKVFKPFNLTATVDEIEHFAHTNLFQLRSLMRENTPRAKAVLAKHVRRLVLTPIEKPSGHVYQVSGGLDLLDNDVMQMVAREGIEPPTPAFSGLLDHRLTDSVAENTRLTGHKFGLHLDARVVFGTWDSGWTPPERPIPALLCCSRARLTSIPIVVS